MTKHIQTGDTDRIATEALHSGNPASPITGLATVQLLIWRDSDGQFYDFNDDTFKAAAHTDIDQQMTQFDATNVPGVYYYDFDTSAITNAVAAGDTYHFWIKETSTTAKNVPQQGELSVGQWMDDIDAAISSRSVAGDAMDLVTDAVDADALAADAIAEIVAALNNLSAQQVRDAMKLAPTGGAPAVGSVDLALDEIEADTEAMDARLPSDPADESIQLAAHVITQAAVAVVQADTDDLQTRLPAALVGGRMDADVAVIQTAALAALDTYLAVTQGHGTGAWDATATGLTAQQVRDAMKLAPTGGAPAAGSVDTHLDDIETDTAAIDGRLPSDPADESLQQASHTQTQADIAALENLSQAQAEAACDAALITYDGPTKAELDTAEANLAADHATTQAAIAALNDLAAVDILTVKQTYAYDRTGDALEGLVWLEAGDGSIVTPTSVSVDVRDVDGTLLFTMTDAGPDAQGFFKVTQAAPGFTTGFVFKAVATMQIPVVGPLTSGYGMFTIG